MPEGKGIGQSAELRAENHKPSHTAGISADRRYSLDLFQVPGCDEADTAVTTCVMLGGIMEA